MALGLSYSQRGRLGALRRNELYGNPGTPEGRSKGGRRSCEYFRSHPEISRQCGFTVRKEIKSPPRNADLAEFIGIMLGDGSVRSKYQFSVSLNYEDERDYVDYVGNLINRLFAVEHIVSRRKGTKGVDLTVSSRSAVEFLIDQGLHEGNKIKNQVDIPEWIRNDAGFRKACLRGLVDTDGSLYRHKYKVNNKWYSYLKIDFTSCSKPLLSSVYKIITDLGIKASMSGVHITISSQSDVNRYCAEVGSSNIKFSEKVKGFWRGG